MSWLYLGLLLLSLLGMILLDLHHRLFFGASPVRAAAVLLAGLAFFLSWDAVGILTGTFLHAQSAFATGWMVAPQLPVEEIVFLTFLCHLTMNLLALAQRALTAAGPRGEERA